jgi:protease YdgD
LSQSAWPDEYRRRLASVIAAAALLLGSGAVPAELLPGVGALDRRLAVDVRLPPWNAIAKVQTNIATHCTGALVGPDTVMTAAHCLYNRRTHALLQPESLHVLFGYERGAYFRHVQVVRYVVGDQFDGAEPARHPASDWARLKLAEAVPTAIEPLRLSKEFPVPGTAVALPGYNQDRIHQLMADTSCRITGVSMIRGERLLTHDCSATRGTSGGPLLARRGDHWEAVGINIAVTASANIALPVAAIPGAP